MEINEALDEIETHYGVRINLAVESGSRLWGFASPDSDWDVRFIYTRPLTWYLGVRERRDVIELPKKYWPLDISGWDLKKALLLLSKSNPPLIEWLNSSQVYMETDDVAKLRDLSKHYFNPRSTLYHYLHMADGNYRTYLRGEKVRLKKYFYVLRPLLCCEYIIENNKFPPVEFDELLFAGNMDAITRGRIAILLDEKKSGGELGEGDRINEINHYIDTKLEEYSRLARTTPKHEFTMDDLDECFFNIVTAP